MKDDHPLWFQLSEKALDKTTGVASGIAMATLFWLTVLMFVVMALSNHDGVCTEDGYYRAAVKINQVTHVVKTESKIKACQ